MSNSIINLARHRHRVGAHRHRRVCSIERHPYVERQDLKTDRERKYPFRAPGSEVKRNDDVNDAPGGDAHPVSNISHFLRRTCEFGLEPLQRR